MKRKPDKVVVHRIELQSKERELLESAIYVNSLSQIIESLARMNVKTLYAWITILEAAGIIKTAIPTLSDADELLATLSAWAANGKQIREAEEAETGAASNRPEWVQKSDAKLYELFYRLLGIEDSNSTA
jgi:hypothetical protein